MSKTILVPLDGSAFSEQSLPLARWIAREMQASVHLVHVHVPVPPDHFLADAQFGLQGVDLSAVDAQREERHRAYLDKQTAAMAEKGVDVRAVWLEGRFEEQLDAHAREVGADLIVLTTHGRTGFDRFWLGSSTDAIIRTTRTPLLLVHPADDPEHVVMPTFENILVPLDGSPESAAVLEPAAWLARAMGARLTLFHSVSSDDLIGGPILPVLVESLPESLERSRQHLERQAEQLRDSGLEVDVAVAHGQLPARAIKAAADDHEADMVAMSTHGYGGVRRLILGSVTDKVLRTCGLPMLIQHPED